ncbi:hypothetical protein DRN73_03060 [Candidatus Pacearchaeota archaeon]|nr:MAG: hypothetical protein DRN73_03060 [Candidatus Pacearchaeota archaeon]
MKKRGYVIQGKRNRAAGNRFELKVRKDMESKGWILDKWTNNVDLEEGKIIPAKRKFNPFLKILGIGTGFPDFIAIKNNNKKKKEIIGVEVKVRGYLDKKEKEKCKFYLKKRLFSKILIAKAKKNGRKIEIKYEDFKEKYKT